MTRYFVFTVIPFGLTTGPKACQVIFKPLLVRWRSLDIISIIFYDDGIIGSEDLQGCEKASKQVYSDLIKANVLPNPKKSQWKPVKKLEWLGFEWDFESGGVRVAQRRIEKFLERVDIVNRIYPKVTARSIARVVGSLISMHLVIGDLCMLRTRYLQNIVNYKHVVEIGWDRKIELKYIDVGYKILDELEFLKSNIHDINFRSFFPTIKTRRLLYGDASEHAVGGILVDGRSEKPFNSDLPDNLIGKSSGERELFALKCALQSFDRPFQNGCEMMIKYLNLQVFLT